MLAALSRRSKEGSSAATGTLYNLRANSTRSYKMFILYALERSSEVDRRMQYRSLQITFFFTSQAHALEAPILLQPLPSLLHVHLLLIAAEIGDTALLPNPNRP